MQSYLDAQQQKIRSSLRGYVPRRHHLRGDIVAGLTFAAVNIPQGLAYALLAGVNPVNGLYTLMIGTPIAALFTGSVLMNVSSTGALSASLADTLSSFPGASRLAALALLCVLIGVFQLLLGLFRLGWVMRFVPNSVMVGFMAGVAINIVLGQLGDLTGFQSDQSNRVLQLADTILNFQSFSTQALTIGLLTIFLIVAVEATRLKGVAMLVALAGASALALLLGFADVPFVRDVAEIPRELPRAVALDWSLIGDLLLPAVALGLLSLVQGAAVGQSFPNPDGRYGDMSRDFSGQGISNIAIGIFQGLPAGGSASGTGVLVGAGAQSRWANIFAGIFVVAITLTLGWLAELVAMPALAGLLVLIGLRMLNFDAIGTVWQTSTVARASGLITFIAALLVPLQYAILVGVGVAVLINVFRQAEKVRLVEYVWSDDHFPEEQPAKALLRSDGVTCLTVYGSLFFAGAATVESSLPDATNTRRAAVLLLLRGRQEVGSTLLTVLERYAAQLRANNNRLILVGVDPEIVRQFERTGLLKVLGAENVFASEEQVGRPLSRAYADAVSWLREQGVEAKRPTVLGG